MNQLYQHISHAITAQAGQITEVARQIHAQPELCFKEYFASQLLVDSLKKLNLKVTHPFGGLETAFCATIGKVDGPCVAILAEYDALPEIGHACGHNLIAGSALGAAVGLAAIQADLPGEVLIIGTPAEEGGGGKIKLIEAGVFDKVEAAMMFHPFDRNVLALDALACDILTFEFEGVPSHAALNPWDGASALTGVIQHFQMVDNARLHFPDGTRVHGIIANGGQAFNIIPETAVSEWCVRAKDLATLQRVKTKVLQCAEAAAKASGLNLKTTVKTGYLNMVNNMSLAQIFGEHLADLGHTFSVTDPTSGMFSTDMGDLSYKLPAIHPYLSVCQREESHCHQKSFADLACSPQGFSAMLLAAQSLARTAVQVLQEPLLLKKIKLEWESSVQKRS